MLSPAIYKLICVMAEVDCHKPTWATVNPEPFWSWLVFDNTVLKVLPA
jgi:hypothetical protein